MSTGVVAATGHRPDKLGGYSPTLDRLLLNVATSFLQDLLPRKVISGMAPGWDMAVAEAALAVKVPVTAAVPFQGQASRWPEETRVRWSRILSHPLTTTVIVTPDGMLGESYGAVVGALHRRNRWMVDRCTRLLTLWDGGETGGTYAAVMYALEKSRPMTHAWGRFAKLRRG